MPDPSPATLAVIAALLEGHTDRHEERTILELLAACPAGDLDAIVASEHLAALVAGVDDRLFGPDHRSSLMRLLTEQRIADLGVHARASLARALARGRTDHRDEQALAALFLATRGAELAALKEAIDASSDYRDLVQLVFHDIDHDPIRSSILEHIAAEAASAPSGLRVLSDIDDTFYANWKDDRYPSKTIYPGVLQLYAELAGAPLSIEEAVVVFVTARPGDRLGIAENASRSALASRGLPRARVLAGAFTRLIGNEALADQKVENFTRYRAVFPESKVVFIGDSGQGDILAGERMLAAAPDRVAGVFIHDVVATPEARRAELAARRVHLFDTYAGAALAAFEVGLLPADGLARVVAAAEHEIAAVPFESEAQRAERIADLERDAARARARITP